MKNLSFKAILVAFIADFGVTQVLATFLSVVAILAIPQARALALSGNVNALTAFLSNSTPFMAMGLVCACVGEVVGGVVAGSLASTHPKPNALAAALVALLFSLILLGSYPMWYKIVAIGSVIPCYFIGMVCAMKRNAVKLERQRLGAQSAPISAPR